MDGAQDIDELELSEPETPPHDTRPKACAPRETSPPWGELATATTTIVKCKSRIEGVFLIATPPGEKASFFATIDGYGWNEGKCQQ